MKKMKQLGLQVVAQLTARLENVERSIDVRTLALHVAKDESAVNMVIQKVEQNIKKNVAD